jgi:hypothetical protein
MHLGPDKPLDLSPFKELATAQGIQPKRAHTQIQPEGFVLKTIDFSVSKPEVELPRYGRNKKEFSADMAALLAPLHVLFQKEGKVVELVMEEFDHQLDKRGLAHGGFKFQDMEPCRAITWVEDHLIVGREIKKEGNN